MLFIIPASNLDPWDYVYQNLLDIIPPGNTYAQTLEMVPLSVKGQDFLIYTDHLVETSVYVNNRFIRKFVPTSQISRLRVRPLAPPATTNFTIVNNIDEPAHLQVTATHQAAHYQAWARQLFEFSANLYSKVWSFMQSPWATFFVEYQLPWQDLLPDIPELRILSVRMAATTLYGEFGLEGGVTDFISAFTLNTPAIVQAKNPDVYSPDLWQPVRSGDDYSGFKAHTWFANICLNRWLAFVTLLNNVDAYRYGHVEEEVVKFKIAETGEYYQHVFDSTGQAGSILGLIDYLGCMDTVTAACALILVSTPSICFWANPFDVEVEVPGIGGGHFDSELEFDGEYGPFDSIYDIDLLTDYWVGASTTNKLDSGGCLDTYNVAVQAPQNTDCCMLGASTSVFTTMATEVSATSTFTPNHPVFGGADPGLLSNPFFLTPYISP